MNIKIAFTFVSMCTLFLVVIVKAFYLQVINRDKLIRYSKSQIVREVKVYPKRGYILDRNGYPLAINQMKYNIFSFGKNNLELKKELTLLNEQIPEIDPVKYYKLITDRNKFTWIARKMEIDKDIVESLKDLKTIVIEPQTARLYPNNELLSQALGFVGVDNDGLSGVEYTFNKELKGDAQIYKYYKDAKGRPIKFESEKITNKAKDITLSIDKDIQANLEEYLREGVEKYDALRGGAAVMDAETGEIWAIANYPSYDPNKIEAKDKDNIKLSFVSDPFEPGSIFKTFTVTSALENNIVKPDTTYYCELGKLKIGKHYVTESDSHSKYEWLTVEEILKFSSNVGTTKIAFDLKYPTLKKTMEKFKISHKTGIEVPGESKGILKDEKISQIKLSNISFGQGIATTGIQMLAAYAPFANGGFYVKPTLLKTDKARERNRIISDVIAQEITGILSKAVSEGTGKNARIRGFDIAGKTSTAQKVTTNGVYDGYIPGFVGYPVGVKKKFVVFVYVDNPKKSYYGNTVAAPIFQKIVKNILFKQKEYQSMAKNRKIRGKNFDTINYKSSSKRSYVKGFVPNLIGLDKSTVEKIMKSLKLEYTHKGFGVVKKQFPLPGEKADKETKISIIFKAPQYE